VASYTLGQCRQSEKEKATEQKAISKRFKFEEPLLQEIPGEFIYWTMCYFIAVCSTKQKYPSQGNVWYAMNVLDKRKCW